MKKYLIGLAVALVFIGYSLVLRHERSKPLVLAPQTNSNNANSAPSNNSSGSSTSGSSPPNSSPTSQTYKDGTYTGSVADAYYGSVQVAAVISGGKISAVNFLDAPHDNPNSQYINSQAKPYLSQEAVQAQSAGVNIISGATLTSQAFIESLTAALNQAK